MDPRDMAPEDRRFFGVTGPLDPEDLGTEELLILLADFIEYDDHRGLKFKRLVYDDEPVQAPMKRKPTVKEVQGRRCPIPTSKGRPCPNLCDHFRPACHVHDPEGKNAKALGPKYQKKMIAALERLGVENKWG
jgi:hypothetical protein